ncbi:MAG: metal-dependent hydrolase [bacterium]|nr:metal-dependent hydrolase [bacterium]
MKGLTHFLVGIAGATFFKKVLGLTIDDNSLILLLGGLYGILPDTIDFKFTKFFNKFDCEIDLDPDNPSKVAKIIASAIDNTDSGMAKQVKLHTLRLGIDLWQQYEVEFDHEQSEVKVRVGPKVTTSGAAVWTPKSPKEGVAQFSTKLSPNIYKRTTVNIFDGPSFKFKQSKHGVEVIFLPWHRRWSHSITVGLLLSLFTLPFGLIYWAISFLSFFLHILVDMLGVMGTNLWFPFTKCRISGLGLFHSSNSFANFGFIWVSAFFIIYNINRFAYHFQIFQGLTVIGIGLLLPIGVIITLYILTKGKTNEDIEKEEELKEPQM